LGREEISEKISRNNQIKIIMTQHYNVYEPDEQKHQWELLKTVCETGFPFNMLSYLKYYGAEDAIEQTRICLRDKDLPDEFFERLYNDMLYYQSTIKRHDA
jgi:hypothetical protein